MAHEAEKDPAFFASISGKLDVIEHLQCEVQDIKEASICHFLCSKTQSATHVMGKVLWTSMMQGHAP